jgi:hypothetical protein
MATSSSNVLHEMIRTSKIRGALICDAAFAESSFLCLYVQFFSPYSALNLCCSLHDSLALGLITRALLSVRFSEKQKCIVGINHGNVGNFTMSKIGLKRSDLFGGEVLCL